MTHLTCRLTAKNRDQLRNPTLGNRISATFSVPFLPFLGNSSDNQLVKIPGAESDYIAFVACVAVRERGGVAAHSQSRRRWNAVDGSSVARRVLSLPIPSGGFKLEGLVGQWPRGPPLLCWFHLPQAYFTNPVSTAQRLKEWKCCFGSCNANFFHSFSSGPSEDHMARASIVGHCTSGHSSNPPLPIPFNRLLNSDLATFPPPPLICPRDDPRYGCGSSGGGVTHSAKWRRRIYGYDTFAIFWV